MIEASPRVLSYFESLNKNIQSAYQTAQLARSTGIDAEDYVEIKLAEDVAARVEGLVGPQGVAERIRELGKEHKREEVVFQIAKEIIEKKFVPEGVERTQEELIDQAIRTGFALFTEGVVSAPIEGISRIKIRKNPDGSRYIAIYYAGPIRNAGGTAQAFSLVLADYCRRILGIENYRPLGDEIERYVEEILLYANRTRAGQYVPKEDEIRHVVNNCPICVDGEPTEDYEVSVYKNLASVETNTVRSGVCLVISEGVCLKAAKVLKITKKIGLDWLWLEKFIKVAKQEAQKVEIKPVEKYMDEIVGGRPIFNFPMQAGGFRLRYGRTRFTGIQAKAIHPATMVLLDEFPAFGTQLKTERPGKGCVITPCRDIEGPVVLLQDEEVRQVNSVEEAYEVRPHVKQILFLGDLLINYGDFFQTNHPLVPSSWCEEWLVHELKEKGVNKTIQELRELNFEEALKLSQETQTPLAPKYTLPWHDLSAQQLKELVDYLMQGELKYDWFETKKMLLPNSSGKKLLELLGLPHKKIEEKIIVEKDWALAVMLSLGLLENKQVSRKKFDEKYSAEKTALDLVNDLASFPIKRKVGIYVGMSMGRPEKSRGRTMKPPVHVLYPLNNMGGKSRDVVKAVNDLKAKSERFIEVEACIKKCVECGAKTWKNKCACGGKTASARQCVKCGKLVDSEKCSCGGSTSEYEKTAVNILEDFEKAVAITNYKPEEVKGVIGLISIDKTIEPLVKGLLRKKHGITVFRDGTIRHDATEIPLTHFIPSEIGLSINDVKKLGYEKDAFGQEITNPDQVIELLAQDIVLSHDAADYLLKTTAFLDDLLVYVYGARPYYNAKNTRDLIGQLAIVIAPHTSAGITARIIGFCGVQGILAHPYLHCATRRNCLHEKTLTYYKTGEKYQVKEISRLFEIHAINKKPFVYDSTALAIDVSEENMLALGTNAAGIYKEKKVKKIIQRPYSGKMLKITTEGGCEVIVTPEHLLWTFENGVLKEKPAQELTQTDFLASLYDFKMPSEQENKQLNDFRKSCEKLPALKDVRVVGIKKIQEIEYTGFVYDLELDKKDGEKIFACGKGMLLSHNCDGDEDSVMLLLDGLLNFSRHYLPATRGGQMDASLVLTTILDPKEVDSEVHGMDACFAYPKEFYEATLKYASPGDVKVELIASRLGKPQQYEGIGFTHHAVIEGPMKSEYVKLKNMRQKVEDELNLMNKIRAVDAPKAAERLLLSHFFPDLYGNLRRFTRQKFRCVECNTKYRRTPLVGKCTKCGGKLLLTVTKGAIEKYLNISVELAEKYDLPTYLKQRLILLRQEIAGIFQDEQKQQFTLANYL